MALSPGTPDLATSFAAEQFLAGLTILGAVALLAALARARAHRPGHGGLVTGADNRYSTGRVIAVGWTLVVGWMVVTEAYIASQAHGTTFASLLTGASNLYFVFLGGPYAAAAFALLSTQTKISQGTLTKIPAEAPNVADVISDDNGNVDTYDFQYTLFNALAIVIVIVSFAAHPGHGLPAIPQFLAILTGGSALTYTVNKALASSSPQITSVLPAIARIGDTLTITGVQLFPNQAGGALPTVTIGGIGATSVAIPQGSTNTLIATVSAAPANTTPLAGAADVTVTPPLATPILLRRGVTIVADKPRITAVSPKEFTAGTTLHVDGTLLLAPGTAAGSTATPSATVGGLTAALRPRSGLAFDVQFSGGYSNDKIGLNVGPQPVDLAGDSGAIVNVTLTLTRGAVSTPPYDLEYKIP